MKTRATSRGYETSDAAQDLEQDYFLDDRKQKRRKLRMKRNRTESKTYADPKVRFNPKVECLEFIPSEQEIRMEECLDKIQSNNAWFKMRCQCFEEMINPILLKHVEAQKSNVLNHETMSDNFFSTSTE